MQSSMDSSPKPHDLPDSESTAASDITTTRPKPFDDDDDEAAAARKRRRTSASDSPVASSSVADVSENASMTQPPSTATTLQPQDTDPRTPESMSPDSLPASQPSSSKVTINLRRLEGAEDPVAELPKSPVPHEIAMDTIEETVETPSLSSTTISQANTVAEDDTIREINTCVPDGSNIAPGTAEVVEMAETPELALGDPSEHFPFRPNFDTLEETLDRIAEYLSDDPNLGDRVLDDLQDWTDMTVTYIDQVGMTTFRETCQANMKFWGNLPDLLATVVNRKKDFPPSAPILSAASRFCLAFTTLTARFIALDCETLALCEDTGGSSSEAPVPLLFSLKYQHQFNIAVKSEQQREIMGSTSANSSEAHVGHLTELMLCFQQSSGGSIDDLAKFVNGLTQVARHTPKIADSLTPTTQLFATYMQHSQYAAENGDQEAKSNLQRGFDVWRVLSSSLEYAVEKHVTCLSGDMVSKRIHGLFQILFACLHSTHHDAQTMLDDCKLLYPNLPASATYDAVAWGQRIHILVKLVKSTQMQLRVMAVGSLSSELLMYWKRLSSIEDDGSIALLQTLGTQVVRTGLIEYIIGSSCHPEIIMDSANIIAFLAITKLYGEEQAHLLWNGISESQDPRVSESICRMLTGTIQVFDRAWLLDFCRRFKSMRMDQFSLAALSLLEAIFRELMKSKADDASVEYLPIELCCHILRSASMVGQNFRPAYPDLHRIAQSKLRELLEHCCDSEARAKIYSACLEDLQSKSETTLGSLWCLSIAARPGIIAELSLLSDQYRFVPLLVEELSHSVRPNGDGQPIPLLFGDATYPRRDFITCIIQHQPKCLENDLGSRLWQILVGLESTSEQDRAAGWQILNTHGGPLTNDNNPFIQCCYKQYLPELNTGLYCDGMLRFVQDLVLAAVNDTDFTALENVVFESNTGIEQLWKVVLSAEDDTLVQQAIQILAVKVYLDSRAVMSKTPLQRHQLHWSLVSRCLRNMSSTAQKVRAATDGTTSGEDESMVVVVSDDEMAQLEKHFVRSLRLLRYFLEEYQSRPIFSAPDIRSLMPSTPSDVRGDLTGLKYQSFNGDVQTAVLPLTIGVENTAGCLLASLRKETGFENYKVYYRGQLFVPSESDICKSLDDLQLKDGLMLVKKEQDTALPAVRVKPGSSSLEIEILAYFEEFWGYLTMADNIAGEIYGFLTKLPAEGNIMEFISAGSASYKDLFVGPQPFKSLYTMFSFCKCLWNSVRRRESFGQQGEQDPDLATSEDATFRVILQLVTEALNDKTLMAETPKTLQPQLLNTQLDTLETLLKAAFASDWHLSSHIDLPCERLLEIIASVNDLKDATHPSLVTKAFQIIMFLAVRSTSFWSKVIEDARFRPVVQHLCLEDNRRQLRSWVVDSIKEAMEATENLLEQSSDATMDGAQNSLIHYFWSAGFELLDVAMRLPHQAAELFRLLQLSLPAMHRMFPTDLDLAHVVRRLGMKLLRHLPAESMEQNPSQADKLCSGLAILLRICMKLDAASVSTATLPNHCRDENGTETQINFPVEMFWRYLFPRCNREDDGATHSLIHDDDTRISLSFIMLHLIMTDHNMLRPMLRAMNEIVPYFVKDESDPYFYELPFQFEPMNALKSSCGYVGLGNLSNTCYLNSLMTQLFMNVGFRRFMLSVQLRDQGQTQQLLSQTQNLFGYLQESMERSKEPASFVNSIKTYDDTVIDIHNQMDVDEFYNLLFDRWEGQMRNSDERNALRSFYGGQLVQQIKSKECEHISERLDSFSAIQCDIKGKTTLEESLQAYVDGEIMEGDNKYKCTSCDRHVDAVKRACLKDVPDHMIFHLKRFDFNLRTLQRNKINDYFAFPKFIDLHPYTVDNLSGTAEPGITDNFELVGILVHTGTAESGHYYSYIKERPTDPGSARWIEFNDEHVSAWDPNRMEDLTFGGSEPRFAFDAGIPGNESKPYSAYMLFYQRSSSLSAEQKTYRPREAFGPARVPMNPELKAHIAEENSILIRRHYMYDPCFINLVERCASLAFQLPQEADPSHDNHSQHQLAMEISLSVLDQIVSRTAKLPNLELYSELIEKSVRNCNHCALCVFEYFIARRYAFRCLVQRNLEPRVRIFMRNLLNLVWEQIASKLPDTYLPSKRPSQRESSDSDDDMMSLQPTAPAIPGRQSVVESTVSLFNYLWKSFHINIRSWDEYFGAVVDFAKRGDCEVSYVLAADYLSKSLQIVSADQSTDPPANYARMLQNVMRRGHSRAVSYESILLLIDYLLSQLEVKLGPDTIVDDAMDRLVCKGAPFPWTANEIQLVHSHSDNDGSSRFVEKLLALDQAPDATYRILSRLINGGRRMDEIIFRTFQRLTNLQASTVEPLDPFLHGAAMYLTSTGSTEHAERLISHVCGQAQAFQNGEGAAFLDFARTSLGPNRDDRESNRQISQYSLHMLPVWAPAMLVYLDGQVRHDTEELIDEHVLRPLLANQNEELPASEEREAQEKRLEGVAIQIAKKCLVYLIDNHIKQRNQLLKDAATSISRVLGRCSEFIDGTDEMTPEEKDEFLATRDEAMNALRPMVVDTVEEDLSDWSNSALSSDQLDDVIESGYFG